MTTTTTTTTHPPVEVVYTITAGKQTGRIHRATCKHKPKGAPSCPPAQAGVDALTRATLATCCSVREIDREHALLAALAAEQAAAKTARDRDAVSGGDTITYLPAKGGTEATATVEYTTADGVWVTVDGYRYQVPWHRVYGHQPKALAAEVAVVDDLAVDEDIVAEAKGTRRGALRDLVEAHLRSHPGEAFTPYQIGKHLGRSSGAVTNALGTLASVGVARHVCDNPRTYQLATEETRNV